MSECGIEKAEMCMSLSPENKALPAISFIFVTKQEKKILENFMLSTIKKAR